MERVTLKAHLASDREWCQWLLWWHWGYCCGCCCSGFLYGCSVVICCTRLGDCRIGCGRGCCGVRYGVSDVLTHIEAVAAVLVALAAAVTQPLQCWLLQWFLWWLLLWLLWRLLLWLLWWLLLRLLWRLLLWLTWRGWYIRFYWGSGRSSCRNGSVVVATVLTVAVADVPWLMGAAVTSCSHFVPYYFSRIPTSRIYMKIRLSRIPLSHMGVTISVQCQIVWVKCEMLGSPSLLLLGTPCKMAST